MRPSRKRSRRLRGVVDTSVLIAGISGFRHPVPDADNKSAVLLRQWIARGSFIWLVSVDIIDEYRDVMARLQVSHATIGRVLNLLDEEAERVPASVSTTISPDPDDEPFCVCAEAGDADFLVTLNPRDFPQARLRSRVIAPGDPLPTRRPSAPGRDRQHDRGGRRRR